MRWTGAGSLFENGLLVYGYVASPQFIGVPPWDICAFIDGAITKDNIAGNIIPFRSGNLWIITFYILCFSKIVHKQDVCY